MASLKFMVLLSICLQGYGLTSALNTEDLESFPDATRTSDEAVIRATKTGDVCQDCTQIFGLLEDLLSNTDIETKMIEGVDHVCDHLPGSSTAANFCREEVEKMLPLAIAFITSAVKPEQACKIMGLCRSCDKQEKMLSYFVKEALLQAAVTSDNKKPITHCSFCLFLINTLEDLLPKERTEALVMKLLEEICEIIPAPYQGQCTDVINKFTKPVLDAILSFATPKNVCKLLRMCKGQDAAPVDPCILITHRCRDVRTALRCGTLLYCQRFVWRPQLDYNSL